MDVRADRYTDVDEEVQGSNLVTSKSSGGSGGQLNIRTSHIQPPLDSVSGYPTVISPLSSARPDTLPAKQKAPHAGVQRSIRQQDGEHDDGVFFTAGTLPRVDAQPRIQKAMPASTKPDPPTKPVRSILKRDATNGDRRVEEEDRRREEKEPSEWEKVEREKTEREIEALQDELVRLRNETLRYTTHWVPRIQSDYKARMHIDAKCTRMFWHCPYSPCTTVRDMRNGRERSFPTWSRVFSCGCLHLLLHAHISGRG